MRVLFDSRPGQACSTGIGRYARTVGKLVRAGIGSHEGLLLGREGVDLAARDAVEGELELPALLEREEIEVFHSPLFYLPAVLPTRAVVTLHDAIPLVRPELASPGFRRLFEGAREAAERADLVVCPSQSARGDVARHLGLTPAQVMVVPETTDPLFAPLDAAEIGRRLAPLGLPSRFLLWVGALEPRKNPLLALQALQQLDGPEADLVLVCAGPASEHDAAAEASRLGVMARLCVLGYVTDELLAALYGAALALVFPSHYEGFGLPLVEAFACGTPVLCSTAGSLPEVAGDAALLFDPADADALAAAVREVARSPERRVELVRAGRARLSCFGPDAVREGLRRVYDSLAGEAA